MSATDDVPAADQAVLATYFPDDADFDARSEPRTLPESWREPRFDNADPDATEHVGYAVLMVRGVSAGSRIQELEQAAERADPAPEPAVADSGVDAADSERWPSLCAHDASEDYSVQEVAGDRALWCRGCEDFVARLDEDGNVVAATDQAGVR